jgi:protein TonB
MHNREVQTPYAQLDGLEAWGTRRFAGALLVALGLHLAVGSRGFLGLDEVEDFARAVQRDLQARVNRELEVDVQPEPEPEPPPPEPVPEPEPPAPEPEPVKPPPTPRAATPPPPAAAAPAAAQAGRVLTAEPTPDEPLDLTGDAFVQGNADYYAGGVTASKGTGTQAVRAAAARADGVVGGKGTAPASGVDRARAAGPVERNWDCPFPAESELEQINYQQVRVAVTVSDKGRALDVKVIGETSFGFGRAAQRCAMSKTYVPALDREGNPVSMTIPVMVTFLRR